MKEVLPARWSKMCCRKTLTNWRRAALCHDPARTTGVRPPSTLPSNAATKTGNEFTRISTNMWSGLMDKSCTKSKSCGFCEISPDLIRQLCFALEKLLEKSLENTSFPSFGTVLEAVFLDDLVLKKMPQGESGEPSRLLLDMRLILHTHTHTP